MRYTVVLEQEPDGGYVVSVPALSGCVSQGDTRAEALANIREAIALYIEDCRDAGDPVPTQSWMSVRAQRSNLDERSVPASRLLRGGACSRAAQSADPGAPRNDRSRHKI
jgi:predicted RNase H-like HicB family nuclease